MLTSTALNTLRTCIQNNIAYAQYKVGTTYYRAEISNTQVLADGRLSITFIVDNTLPGAITVTEVQLYDHNGVLWASKAESIKRSSIAEGILYRFTFSVLEG